MDDCRNSLEALEKLLNEFFSPGTSNERQRELENILSTFSGRPESWRLCLQFLTLTSNQYVAMYCLATIESVITKRWLVLLTEEKSELTSLLYKHLLARHTEFPHFIRNKLLKLIVDIARYDWPHFYPDFFMNICKMIQDPNTTVLGLSFLQTASEELICPREDLSVCRKDELKRLFTAHIPNVFKIICDVLEGVKEGRSSQAVGAAALQAVCHLFSWVPLQSQATHSALLALVFHFTCTPDNLGVCALAVLNEVLYKNCVPHSLLPSVFVVCTQNHQLLHLVLQQSDLANIDENYINKLTEMSHLCLSKHWHRIEQNHLFPVNDFLYALYQYTFRQPTVTTYYACLEVWTSLLDYLADKDAVHIHKYEEFATALVEAVIKKMKSDLDLDDEKTDDDEETERQVFIRHNIEVIGKIGDIVPMATCSRVVDAWQKCCAAYSKLLFATEPPQPGPELRRVLLDCAALTQTVGHIHGHLSGTMNLSMSLSGLAVAASRTVLHEKVTDPDTVKLLVAVHAEVIAALPTWLSTEHVNTAVEACLPLLQSQHTVVKLQLCAAHLLAALANKKFSPHPLPTLLPLFQTNLGHLNQETQTLVQSALCRILMTCPPDIQTEEQRLELMTNLVKSMMPSGTQDLRQITALLVHCKPENKQAKQLLYSALQPVLENVIAEFPVRMNTEPQVCDQMLSFFLEAFRALQEHIGADMTQRAVETFINAFRSVDIITRECGVDKLLQLLVLIVEQASGIFKQFIPSCVTLCLDHIYPAVYNSPNSNIKPCLFHLLYSILLHKWQYFYSGSVADGEPELQNGHQLAAILQAFGESLMQNDITLFSQNLQALEILNLQWKLYQRELFRTQFLPEYLTLLLNTLILKTHALRADEIATAIYNMATVDFETFYLFFLPHFLDHTTGLDSNQRMVLRRNMKADQDLPTFIQNVHRLANDIRCYRLCNGTNPAAS
ncbi:exportin-6-A isoform X2 [Macrosteles quadrilineatus]|uniref:exportin-6-A isoform X2 n=1 Tax=Macrosteles quadrilineatus TaxID=74068 RepID=UPI0023E11A09|nr:exportin-6-A isoform X2 [Macrosteles quadrilineatus]